MGKGYSLQCDNCGYHPPDLLEGIGKLRQQYVIVQCCDCHRLSSLRLGEIDFSLNDPKDVDLQGKRCPHCRSTNIEHYLVNINGKNRCPKCGELSMRIGMFVNWD